MAAESLGREMSLEDWLVICRASFEQLKAKREGSQTS
jgi:hypothetical protein